VFTTIQAAVVVADIATVCFEVPSTPPSLPVEPTKWY